MPTEKPLHANKHKIATQPPADPAPPTAANATPTLPAQPLTPDFLPRGVGPPPATRAEFAHQVLKRIASNPPSPTPPHSMTPTATNPTAINQRDEELRSPVKPAPTKPACETTDETLRQLPTEPQGQPPQKKRYEARFNTNINWPLTGTETAWGWTSDP